MSDGVNLDADVFRPDAAEKIPAILSVHCYSNQVQSASSIMPRGMGPAVAAIESGDPYFYARRGYAHIICNVRGSGRSGGEYTNYGPREVKDTYETIEWLAKQPWCDGNVGMFGVSYFAIAQKQVAALNPPHLKAIFAPWGYTDFYRDKFYHGGILNHGFMMMWSAGIDNGRPRSWTLDKLGKEKYEAAIAKVLQDRDLQAVPYLVQALRNPKAGANPLIVDILLNPLDGPYYEERDVHYQQDIKIPTYTGACWANAGLHLNGAFRDWENIKAPKKMLIAPPIYLDRPVYQLQYESLRWFDHWLKGVDTGIMQEPLVRVFVMGTGEWKESNDWPLPETKWTPFYLHERGLLSEHDFWPNEGNADTFFDAPNVHDSLTYTSPVLVENTEVIGPILLRLYASTTDTELLWFNSLLDIDGEGHEKLLTRGWLRGSLREVDESRSKPWRVFHPFNKPMPLARDEIYEFTINIAPIANLFKAGHRIALRLKCGEDERPANMLEGQVVTGHLCKQSMSAITVHHDAEHQSQVLLPITRGNIIGTYMSGGKLG